VCVLVNATSGASVTQLATAVPVSNGAFSGVAAPDTLTGQCRLRAVPTGVDAASTYIGSYAGPSLYEWAGAAVRDSGNVPYSILAVDEHGEGIGEALDASQCGTALLARISMPGMDVLGPATETCMVALPSGNLTSTGVANASAVKVDGHNAYLPYAIHNYLIQQQSLALTQSTLTTTFSRNSAGVLTWTESAPLERCSGDNTYPPTSTSCPNLTSTGVTFKRTGTMSPDGPTVAMQDQFLSSDGSKHTVTADYAGTVPAPDAGAAGFLFPGNGTTFQTPGSNEVVTGLGTHTGTVLIRSDLHAFDGDPQADTLGLTYSKAPSKAVFAKAGGGAAPAEYELLYSLAVPAHGSGYLRFTAGWGLTVADARALGSSAQAASVNRPNITAPKQGATITGHKVTVKGTVSLGANGLPNSVTVNGHAATLTSTGSYSITLSEPYGTHTLTAKAIDSAGSSASRAIKVTNKA
jgi:hypothetical protein